MVKLIDDVCEQANADGEREKLTRSKFIALCVLYFAGTPSSQANEKRKES